jgi:hypothetical protein
VVVLVVVVVVVAGDKLALMDSEQRRCPWSFVNCEGAPTGTIKWEDALSCSFLAYSLLLSLKRVANPCVSAHFLWSSKVEQTIV